MQPLESAVVGASPLFQLEDAAQREQAFAALVHRQSRFVFRVAYALLRNQHDAEDIVQETFMKLLRNKSWDRMNDERAFLATTAWRLALGRLPNKSLEPLLDHDPHSPAQDPEQAALSQDSNAWLHRMIDTLPEDLRQPLSLTAVQDLNSREIAAILGISEGTVRTRLMRARQLLKEKIRAMESDPRGGNREQPATR